VLPDLPHMDRPLAEAWSLWTPAQRAIFLDALGARVWAIIMPQKKVTDPRSIFPRTASMEMKPRSLLKGAPSPSSRLVVWYARRARPITYRQDQLDRVKWPWVLRCTWEPSP